MYNDITKKKQLRYKNEMKANDIINILIKKFNYYQ